MTWGYDSDKSLWYSTYTKWPSPYLDRIRRDVDASTMTSSGKAAYDGATWNEDIDTPANSVLTCWFTSDPVAADKTKFDDIIANLIAMPTEKGRWYKSNEAQQDNEADAWTDVNPTLSKADLRYGRYHVSWYCDVQCDAGTTGQVQIIVDDTIEGGRRSVNSARDTFSGAGELDLDDGAHNVKFQLKRTGGTGKVYIEHARIWVETNDTVEDA